MGQGAEAAGLRQAAETAQREAALLEAKVASLVRENGELHSKLEQVSNERDR